MENEKRPNLIDRNILVGKDGLFSQRGCRGNCQYCNLWTEDGCRVILEAPTVDAVEIVHGWWETVEDRRYLGAKCSNCQKWWLYKETNYCPNCGAKMDEQ